MSPPLDGGLRRSADVINAKHLHRGGGTVPMDYRQRLGNVTWVGVVERDGEEWSGFARGIRQVYCHEKVRTTVKSKVLHRSSATVTH